MNKKMQSDRKKNGKDAKRAKLLFYNVRYANL